MSKTSSRSSLSRASSAIPVDIQTVSIPVEEIRSEPLNSSRAKVVEETLHSSSSVSKRVSSSSGSRKSSGSGSHKKSVEGGSGSGGAVELGSSEKPVVTGSGSGHRKSTATTTKSSSVPVDVTLPLPVIKEEVQFHPKVSEVLLSPTAVEPEIEEESIFVEDDNAEVLLEGEEEVLPNTADKKRNKRRVVNKESFRNDFESFMASFECFLDTVGKWEAANGQGATTRKTGLTKKLRQLQNDGFRLLKIRNSQDDKPRGENSSSGFMKPIKVSPDLAAFLNLTTEEPVTRVLITKKLCQYIKEKDLQNPEDRRQILPDDRLRNLFRLTENSPAAEDKLTYYSMQKAIQQHIYKV